MSCFNAITINNCYTWINNKQVRDPRFYFGLSVSAFTGLQR